METDTKTRIQSIRKMMNKRGVKAGRMLVKALEDREIYTVSQLAAAESICRLNIMVEMGLVGNGDYSRFSAA